ncbi:hypothetical protein BH23ACT9_BH23ACT9_32350 [soil metagenome]
MDHSLRRARLRSGLSLRQLASLAGTSHSTLLAYEQGTKDPRSSTRERIIRAAGFVPDHTLVRRLRTTVHDEQSGEELRQVLHLAQAFPSRHDPELAAPVFPPRRSA